MKSRNLLFTAMALLTLQSASADYTSKPMSDDEIKRMIIQGIINNFNNGVCYQKTLVPTDPPLPPTDVGDDTNTGRLKLGNYYSWSYEMGQEAKRKLPTPKPKPIYRCECPCPYSRNNQSEPCGESSAYFSYPEDQRPRCYPEDIQTWEVSDFRNLHEIPTPSK